MNRPQRASAWPWAADTPLDRARRVAWSYRAALAEVDAEAVARIDIWAAAHGQGWAAPSSWPHDEDDLLTRAEVAMLCHVLESTVYRWGRRGLREIATVDGIRIRVGDLLEFERQRRLRRRGG